MSLLIFHYKNSQIRPNNRSGRNSINDDESDFNELVSNLVDERNDEASSKNTNKDQQRFDLIFEQDSSV